MGGLVDCSLHGEAFTFYVQDAVSSSGGDTLSTALLCSPLLSSANGVSLGL